MEDNSFDEFEDLSKFLKDFLKSFEKDGLGRFSNFSISRTYQIGDQPGGSNGSATKGTNKSKMYTFKDFNIRYYFNQNEPQRCYLNLTNVPPQNPIQKVYMDKQMSDSMRLKIYIDCGKYFIVDFISVTKPYHTLESYSVEKSTNSRILILNLRL